MIEPCDLTFREARGLTSGSDLPQSLFNFLAGVKNLNRAVHLRGVVPEFLLVRCIAEGGTFSAQAKEKPRSQVDSRGCLRPASN